MLMTKFQMGWTYLDKQQTKKKPTPNLRNIHIANAQLIDHYVVTRSKILNMSKTENVSWRTFANR